MGDFLFTIVALTICHNKGIDITNTGDVFFYVAPLLALGCLAGSVFLFKKQVNVAINKHTLKEKLMAYQGALIQRYAFINGATMFAIVVYIQTGNLYYLTIAGFLMLCLLAFRPTKDKIENDLNLSYEDKMLFNSEEAL